MLNLKMWLNRKKKKDNGLKENTKFFITSSNYLPLCLPSPKSYQKYFLRFSSSLSLSEQYNPNALSGARQSRHLLWVGNQDGPEQSVRASVMKKKKTVTTLGVMASHTVLEPKVGERSIHTEEQTNMECRSQLRRAAWHSVLEHKQGNTGG